MRDARAQDLVLQQLEATVQARSPRFPPHLQVRISISECELNENGELIYRGRR